VSIFSNIEAIRDLHNEIYKELLQIQDRWPDVDGIGAVFLKLVSRERKRKKEIVQKKKRSCYQPK
jgi:hypothetical protein